MMRLVLLLVSVVVAAGCVEDNPQFVAGGAGSDLAAAAGGDLSLARRDFGIVDLATPPDLTVPTCGVAGLPCCANDGCAQGLACANHFCGAAASCAALNALNSSWPSGVYSIDPDGAGPIAGYHAYCDMSSDGGGWALAAKIDGAAQTFLWDAAPWTDLSTMGANDVSQAEAKLAAFNYAPFTQIRIVVRDGGMDRAAVLVPQGLPAGSTLHSVFAGGAYYPTALTPAGWIGLLQSGSLQTKCGLEGVNGQAGWLSQRIGVFGNQENDCNSCDSSIGVGGRGYAAGNDANAQWDDSGAGGRMTRPFVFLWIR